MRSKSFKQSLETQYSAISARLLYKIGVFAMMLKITKSKNATSLYVIKSYYRNGVRTSKIVEKLGTYA